MDTNALVTLLTINVVLLSLVIITLLILGIMVLVKLRKVMNNIDIVVHNVAAATDWLSPIKLVSHLSKLFRK